MFGCAEDQARFEELSAAHRTALEAEDIAALEKIQVELAELMKRGTLNRPPPDRHDRLATRVAAAAHDLAFRLSAPETPT